MDQQATPELSTRVRVMQIIVLALAMGIAAFFVIATYLRSVQPPRAAGQEPILSYLAAFFAAMQIAASMVVPSLIANAQRRKLTGQGNVQGKLLNIYQTRLIIACAILEGAAFFCLLAYLVEGLPFTQILAGLLLAGVVFQFPTVQRVQNWLGEQQADEPPLT